MSEIREQFDFLAALERARKVVLNPNAVVECVRGVSIDWQDAANVAKPVRKRRPRGRRRAARSGTHRGWAGATRQGGSSRDRTWIREWETNSRQGEARWPPGLAGAAVTKKPVFARLVVTLFGPDANERWNLPCLRQDTRPEEQRVAEVVSVVYADVGAANRRP